MIVLVVNCGSSSLKYQLVNMDNEEVMAKGLVEKITLPDARLTHKWDGRKKETVQPIPDHKVAVKLVLDLLTDPEAGVIKSMKEIDAVGHRVVHGGEEFASSTLITDEVMKALERCSAFAPLHNPPNIIGIKACRAIMPEVPQVGVFDTSFHQTMPPEAYMYGLPYELYKEDGIRRYGFHGTSHRYVADLLRLPPRGGDAGAAHREAEDHHLPPGQRELHHRGGRRQVRRYLDGLHAACRYAYGYALRGY